MSTPCQFFGDKKTGFPVGAIVAYMYGTFTNTSNGGFGARTALGRNASTIDAIVRPLGWKVCNGAAINDPDSPFFKGAGRHVPNLTVSRFIRGSTSIGATGGTSTSTSHVHTIPAHTINANEMAAHTHTIDWWLNAGGHVSHKYGQGGFRGKDVYTGSAGGGRSHKHGNTGKASGSATNPPYMTVLYLMRFK